ncbi:MAG: MFS transporter [Fimbriimonadaceae bacterium]|nr:MFS transporter [Fimbriimonadaceae bacterium]
MRRPTYLTAAFMTVFLDFLSFGVVIPDVQLRGESLGLTGASLGFVLAIYSIAQFLVAPTLGSLSDRIGRRKILILTCALAVVAGFFYAYSTELWAMIVSRLFLGVAGANLGVVYAYVADVTVAEERTSAMGKLGAAFGLGFMFGPPLGAWLVHLNDGLPVYLGYVSGIFAFINLLFVWFLMPEVEPRDPAARGNVLKQLKAVGAALRTPALGLLLSLFFMANFAFANLESTYYRLMKMQWSFSQMDTTWILLEVGLVAAIVQGGVVRPLAKRFGEATLLRVGYALMVPGLAVVPFAPPWGWVILGAAVLGVANGIAQPSLSSLVSQAAAATVMGGVFGVQQSLGAIARMAAPPIGNSLIEVQPWLPYVFGATLMLYPAIASWRVRMPDEQTAPVASDREPEPNTDAETA